MRTARLVSIYLLLVVIQAAGQRQTESAGTDAKALFERGMNALAGSSATRSGPDAIDSFRRSAELDYVPAQVVLGYLNETGQGVTADQGQAFNWYKKAASQDDPLAEWLAARVILAGEVPPRDFNQAAKWLEQASGHGDPFAEYLLGTVALERSNYALAAQQFRNASDQGLPQAQVHLAALLREGRGTAVDYFEAYVWMLAGRDNGLRVNESDLQSLEAELGSARVADAKIRARDLETRATRSVAAHGCTGWRGEFDEIPSPPPPDIQRFCR